MDMPDVMSGVVMTGYGGPDKLEWRDDLPVPRALAGDVVVQVAAAAVNNTDINTRIGWYAKGDIGADDTSWSGTPMGFPRVQGADVCGRIVAVGAGVDAARIGQRVLIEPCLREVDGTVLDTTWYFGSECDGGFAQFTRVAARHAHTVDSALSDVELASFPCSYSTAENMLTRTNVQSGDTVLVTGDWCLWWCRFCHGAVGPGARCACLCRDQPVQGPNPAGLGCRQDLCPRRGPCR